MGIPPIMGGAPKDDEELDSDDGDDLDDDDEDDDEDDGDADEGDDEEEDDEDDGASKKKSRAQGDDRKKFKPITTQAELDRIVQKRLDRQKKSLLDEIDAKLEQRDKDRREEAKARKEGRLDAVIAKRDARIKELEAVESERDSYAEYFETLIEERADGLPSNVLTKLMPKNLSPLEKLEWIDEYRAAHSKTRRRRQRDEDAEDEEGEDDADARRTTSSKGTSATKRAGNSRRPPAKGGKVPTADELLKQARSKTGARRF